MELAPLCRYDISSLSPDFEMRNASRDKHRLIFPTLSFSKRSNSESPRKRDAKARDEPVPLISDARERDNPSARNALRTR